MHNVLLAAALDYAGATCIANLRRDIDLMRPRQPGSGIDPPRMPTFDRSVYEAIVHPVGQEEAQEELMAAVEPWLAAYPTEQLQETSFQRQSRMMATVLNDVAWQEGNFVMLRVTDDSADPFWVARITKSPWVEVLKETGEDMAFIQAQWYVPPSGGKYTGWLQPMVTADKQRKPVIEKQHITSVFCHFKENEGTGAKQGWIKVPGREVTKVLSWQQGADSDSDHL
jgi:hypothetical protein